MSADLTVAIEEFQRCINGRDGAGADRILDADYALVVVIPARAVAPRARWLEMLPDYVVHDYVVEEQVVDEDGDHAAVLSRVRMQATVLGEDRSGVFALSDIWRRSDGAWKVWRRHSTPLSAGLLPGVESSSPGAS
jgi:ketosteroid isomerase-like protein